VVSKSPEAFRTISEVAETLDVPPHVLRFWESRFTQVKPVKRGGGRRYYRPEDVRLLRGIRGLLYDDGMTIKGVQKILRERGVRHVIGLGAETEPAVTETNPSAPAKPRPAPAKPKKAPEVAANGPAPPQPDLFEGGTTTATEVLPKIDAPAEVTASVAAEKPAGKPDRKAELRRIIGELEALRTVMLARPEG
jgi:DNA-binding transcriptional MerR regulator